jgi:hypothetical protein
MKIAVCVSGQIRTWKDCVESWKRLFKELQYADNCIDTKIEVDYFVHTWDFNSQPFSEWSDTRKGIDGYIPPPSENANMDDIMEFINYLNPKKYLIESEEKSLSRKISLEERSFFRTEDKRWPPLNWAGSQLYGIMMAGYLKRQYEIENNFEYDMCIRMRPDIHFEEFSRIMFAEDFTKIQRKTIYSVHGTNINYFPFDIIGDIFFYSDSLTYDMLSNLYNWIPQIDLNLFDSEVTIEMMLAFYIRMLDIKNIKVKIDPQVKR